jgi:hypothetical protein
MSNFRSETNSWGVVMRTRLLVQTLCVQILIAVPVSAASAACLNPPASSQAINQFKSDPQALVAPNSDTRTIEATARDLAGTDASLAADLVRVATGTVPRFQNAIAAGLAQAAIACANVDQQAALLIQQAVAGFQDGQFQASFAAVAGDLSTAATEAATAFATSSVGSVVITNPNTSRASTSTHGGGSISQTSTSPGGLILADTASPSTTPTTPSTTAAEPVSATR